MNKLVRIPPPIIALLLLTLAFAADRNVPDLPPAKLPATGLVLMAVGFALALSALQNFLRLRTTVIPDGEPAALATQGPYGWTRNPMYLGLSTALLGLAFYFGRAPLFFVPLLLFFILGRAHIGLEEATLGRLFGAEYDEYRRRVGRWL